MTKDAPAFDLSAVLAAAASLAAAHGVKVRVSRSGSITVEPVSVKTTSTERVKAYRARKAGTVETSETVKPCNAGNDETHETHETHETRNVVSPPSPSPSLPLSPQTPLSPARPLPPTPVGAARTREASSLFDSVQPDPSEYPTLAEVEAWAESVMAPRECAAKWHAENDAANWMDKHSRPLTADKAKLRNLFGIYATSWKANERNSRRGKHEAYTAKSVTEGLTPDQISGEW